MEEEFNLNSFGELIKGNIPIEFPRIVSDKVVYYSSGGMMVRLFELATSISYEYQHDQPINEKLLASYSFIESYRIHNDNIYFKLQNGIEFALLEEFEHGGTKNFIVDVINNALPEESGKYAIAYGYSSYTGITDYPYEFDKLKPIEFTNVLTRYNYRYCEKFTRLDIFNMISIQNTCELATAIYIGEFLITRDGNKFYVDGVETPFEKILELDYDETLQKKIIFV